MIETLASLMGATEGALFAAILVFARTAGAVAMLPGFGEQMIPARVKLAGALAFSAVVWPMVGPGLPVPTTIPGLLGALVAEAVAGLLLGLSVRILVMALQFAGSTAAQSTALAQLLGPGATPDPMPALGNVLVLGSVALALALDLHIRFIEALALSYQAIPLGRFPEGAAVAAWGVAHGTRAFALGLTLAAPFVIGAFAYNLALGAINRAMPQLMVAMVGAPAITWGTLMLLFLAAPLIATSWAGLVAETLADPFGLPR